ncbi:MAG: tetratricopeptide repeat protein, partial [Bacteroidota bacterium]
QLAAGDYAKARAAFSVVAKRTNSEMTAESKYSIAYIAFMEGDYKESQRLSMEVQNQVPAYDYWIAKSFILLGDNYLAQRDTFQARETYKSIVDNFDKGPDDPDDLSAIARAKYDAIVEQEAARNKEGRKRAADAVPSDTLEISPIK